jgi:hypothetical protein
MLVRRKVVKELEPAPPKAGSEERLLLVSPRDETLSHKKIACPKLPLIDCSGLEIWRWQTKRGLILTHPAAS